VIGEQIQRQRRLREMTQEELAARAAVSVDTIRRLEQGNRHTARLATLKAIADALDAELSVIIAPRHTFSPDPAHGVHAIRRAVTTPALAGLADLADPHDDVDLGQLAASTDAAWTLWQRGGYNALGGLLPALIAEARNATRETTGDEQGQAWSLLATVHEVAAGVVVMLGYEDLAWLSAERAADAASRSGDLVTEASAQHWLSWILRRQGRYTDSERLATRAAERYEPASLMRARPRELTVWGGLLVNASGAAARDERTDAAGDLLNVAEGAAGRLGANRVDRWSVFGRRTVAQTRVVNAVEVGDYDAAAALAVGVDAVGGQVPATWEARYLLALAQAHAGRGDDTATVRTLSSAVRVAGEWVRYHRLARDLTLDVIGRMSPQRNADLDGLVRHLQLVD
jgi:transcriptional regulator with XRE-family HTH domain